MLSRTISGLAPSRGTGLECRVRKLRKYPLLLESAESESLQNLFANIRGQSDFRLCTCDICNRRSYACVYRGCQKGVDLLARMRPGEYRCHARDLPALVDLVSHGCVEVGTCRKQRVKVGQYAVLPDEAMGPVEVGVEGASHHLALVVDAAGKCAKISRQKAEVCDCAVLPKSGISGCAVRAATLPNNLALVVNAVGDIGTSNSEVRKREGSAVFPQYGVKRSGAGSRVAYGLALIVDPDCDPVWIATHRRKRLGFAFFPQHRQCSLKRGARGTSRVNDSRFRKSGDLSAVIDRAGLPVISAHRRESAHVAVSPNKRTTRKPCAEAANVFAVGIGDGCFGHTDRCAALVDLTPVHPTVRSSKRTEIDLEPVDVDRRTALYKCPKNRIAEGGQGPIHDLRPTLIIDVHGTTQIPIVHSAQIGNFVAHLSDRIAEASQNNRRNPRYPEIPQPSKRAHISSVSSEQSLRAEMHFSAECSRCSCDPPVVG